MRQLIWTCVVVWLAGCDTPADVKAQIACTTLCNCFGGPIGKDACVSDCVEDSGIGQAPDDCFECIQAHASECSTLQRDCNRLCLRPPAPGDLPDGGSR